MLSRNEVVQDCFHSSKTIFQAPYPILKWGCPRGRQPRRYTKVTLVQCKWCRIVSINRYLRNYNILTSRNQCRQIWGFGKAVPWGRLRLGGITHGTGPAPRGTGKGLRDGGGCGSWGRGVRGVGEVRVGGRSECARRARKPQKTTIKPSPR